MISDLSARAQLAGRSSGHCIREFEIDFLYRVQALTLILATNHVRLSKPMGERTVWAEGRTAEWNPRDMARPRWSPLSA